MTSARRLDVKVRGVVKKLGIEGGVLSLITDDGRTVELIGAPASLRDGMRVEVSGDRERAEMTIGMVGDALVVRTYKAL